MLRAGAVLPARGENPPREGLAAGQGLSGEYYKSNKKIHEITEQQITNNKHNNKRTKQQLGGKQRTGRRARRGPNIPDRESRDLEHGRRTDLYATTCPRKASNPLSFQPSTRPGAPEGVGEPRELDVPPLLPRANAQHVGAQPQCARPCAVEEGPPSTFICLG